MTVSQCKLTGEMGKLVKCHILPKALTRPSKRGAPLLQGTRGRGYLRRWDSWYDSKIVTLKGENILGEIDDLAIKELRRTKLIWSSWSVAPPVFEKMPFISPNHHLRKLVGANQEDIWRFLISIAWRTSVSVLTDMREFKLSVAIEEQMRSFLLGQKTDFSLFPISLTQLSTKGEIQNQSPYLDTKVIPAFQDTIEKCLPIVRIYIDGLVAHIHLEEIPDKEFSGNVAFLGGSDTLAVIAIDYEVSFQYENLLLLQFESMFGPTG